VKGEEEREIGRSSKIGHKKLKTAGNPRGIQSGALKPPIRAHHVATTCIASPLRIKYGIEPQESCLSKKPFTF